MNAAAVTPSAGWMADGVHRLLVRVYYEDTDVAGIVYYANYLRYLERGRTDMLRLAGVDQHEVMAREGVVFAVRACAIEYLSPARLDDALHVATRIQAARGASLEMVQEVLREDAVLARAELRIACVSVENGAPARIPSTIREAVAELVAPIPEPGAP